MAGTLWFIDFERTGDKGAGAGDKGAEAARDVTVMEAVAAPLQAAEMAAAGGGDAEDGAGSEPAGRALHSFSEVWAQTDIRVCPSLSESVRVCPSPFESFRVCPEVILEISGHRLSASASYLKIMTHIIQSRDLVRYSDEIIGCIFQT